MITLRENTKDQTIFSSLQVHDDSCLLISLSSLVALVTSAQNERSELAVDPDVDEEVGEVVDVHEVQEMSGQHQTRVERDEERRERGHAHQEQPCSDLHRLFVNAGLRLVTTRGLND